MHCVKISARKNIAGTHPTEAFRVPASRRSPEPANGAPSAAGKRLRAGDGPGWTPYEGRGIRPRACAMARPAHCLSGFELAILKSSRSAYATKPN